MKNQLTLIGFSGGGARIAQMMGAWDAVKSEALGHRLFTGVSSGALLAFAFACLQEDSARSMIRTIELDDIFSKPVLNRKGKFNWRCLVNILMGKPYLTDMVPLYETIRSVVSAANFNLAKKHAKTACVVFTVDLSDGSLQRKDIFSMSYEEAVEAVVQSCAIPGFTQAPGGNEFDGGLRIHNPAAHFINQYKSEPVIDGLPITRVISIWSRPKELKSIPESKHSKNIFSRVLRTTEIQNWEISKDDERQEDLFCDLFKIPQLKVFTQSGDIQHVYDFDRARIQSALLVNSILDNLTLEPNSHWSYFHSYFNTDQAS